MLQMFTDTFKQTLAMDFASMSLLSRLIILIVGLVVSWLLYIVLKQIILKLVARFFKSTKSNFDDLLIEYKTLNKLLLLIPIGVLAFVVPALASPLLEEISYKILASAATLVFVMALHSFLKVLLAVYNELEVARTRPIKSYVQVVVLVMYAIAIVLIIAILLSISPVAIVTALGAITAVLVFVFRDTILGLVASFQIVSGDIIHIGDWLEAPQFAADGEVMDISLHTVRVKNFDNTITSIPPYKLASDAFKNWRGMQESKVRRIKRSIYIDLRTIRFCDASDIEEISKVRLIKDYISSKSEEINAYNKEHDVSPTELGSRRMSNIGIFREYLKIYLRQNPNIDTSKTLLVRQLSPGEHGLPIEIYVFANDTDWGNYEEIQANIFDHVMAMVPVFGLKIFQNVSGSDVERFLERK